MTDKNNVTNGEILEFLKSMSSQNAEIKQELALIRKQITAQDSILLEVREENIRLRNRNTALEEKVGDLEKKLRKNNIVLYNLEESESNPLPQQIVHFLDKQLNIRLELYEINSVYRIGKNIKPGTRGRPVLIELNSNLKKSEILRSLKKTKRYWRECVRRFNNT